MTDVPENTTPPPEQTGPARDVRGPYARRPFLQFFHNPELEAHYRDFIAGRTLLFSRGAWLGLPLLTIAFVFLDRPVLGEAAGTLTALRVPLSLFGLAVLGLSFTRHWRRVVVWSPSLFILAGGLFTSAATALSDPTVISPYFNGLFLTLAGVFCVAGLGSAYALYTMLFILAFFLVLVIGPGTLGDDVLVVYNFFLPSGIAVFAYASYLVEHTARDNFVTSVRLQTSLSEVKQLSGLLPICAACKKVRNDEGYWNQIEDYISHHTEAEFSHGICPDCEREWYPEQTEADER